MLDPQRYLCLSNNQVVQSLLGKSKVCGSTPNLHSAVQLNTVTVTVSKVVRKLMGRISYMNEDSILRWVI